MTTFDDLAKARAAQLSASLPSTLGEWVIGNIWNLALALTILLWSIVGADFYLN